MGQPAWLTRQTSIFGPSAPPSLPNQAPRPVPRFAASNPNLRYQQQEMRYVTYKKVWNAILKSSFSAVVHSLPPPSFQTVHDQAYTPSSYEAPIGKEGTIYLNRPVITLPAYTGLSSLPLEFQYNDIIPAQFPPITGQRQSSSPNRRRTSARVAEVALLSPSMRDRTPIRHHRSSLPRDRSSTRPEALLAYVSDQQNQQSLHQAGRQTPVLPSQVAPNASMMFHIPNYSPQASGAYIPQSLYYQAPPLQQNDPHYISQTQSYSNEASRMQYYPVQSFSSHTSTATGAAFGPQGSLYAPTLLSSNTQRSQHIHSTTESSVRQPTLPTPAPLESSREEYLSSAARPKPQCFEHGCNGREFSTFSNLLRHQRERSGSATKSVCPHCGTEFTRTTARNGHLTSGKCKGKLDSGQSVSGSDTGN